MGSEVMADAGREAKGGCALAQRLDLSESAGQASVEYAVVLVAFLATLVALGAMWHAAKDSRILRLAVEAASHGTSGGITAGFLQDVALF